MKTTIPDPASRSPASRHNLRRFDDTTRKKL